MKKQTRRFFGALAIVLVALLLFPTAVLATGSDDDWSEDDSRPHRVEPQGEGTVYEVSFIWEKGTLYEPMAALEGHGLGPEQWVEEWHRTDYTFMGWYDNVEGTGERYTMYTPIYQDTFLYALWKYAGVGGPWPRPKPSGISGLAAGENLQPGATVTITAAGHNTHLVDPPSQRFRWIPVSWRVEGLGQGQFSSDAPYTATIGLATAGSYSLYITYREEVYDSITWQATQREHEVEELPFSVGFEYAATNNPPASTRQPPPTEGATSEAAPETASSSTAAPPPASVPQEAPTERSSPLAPILVAVLVLLAAGAGVWLFLRRRKRKHNELETPPPAADPWDEEDL